MKNRNNIYKTGSRLDRGALAAVPSSGCRSLLERTSLQQSKQLARIGGGLMIIMLMTMMVIIENNRLTFIYCLPFRGLLKYSPRR